MTWHAACLPQDLPCKALEPALRLIRCVGGKRRACLALLGQETQGPDAEHRPFMGSRNTLWCREGLETDTYRPLTMFWTMFYMLCWLDPIYR